MIKSKEDLKMYLDADARALGIKRKHPKLFGDDIWKFQCLMRRCEYSTTYQGVKRIFAMFLKFRYLRMCNKMNYSIPLNVFGPGLALVHRGPVVVSPYARVGKNCRLQTMTCIGATNGEKTAPQIGDNVYIAVGAKVIGNIQIANNVAIGAGAVVVKDVLEENTTWGGVPAKKISNNGSDAHIQNQR